MSARGYRRDMHRTDRGGAATATHRWHPRRVLAAISALGATVLVGCGSGDQAPSESNDPGTSGISAARLVGPAEFASAIAEPDRVTLNVHVPFEGDIAGTDLSIPFDQIAANAENLPADRDTALAVYCRSGPMSTIAAQSLADLGYTDIVELRGGMRAWRADGRPLVTDPPGTA